MDDWLMDKLTTWYDSKWLVPSLLAVYVPGFVVLGICLYHILGG